MSPSPKAGPHLFSIQIPPELAEVVDVISVDKTSGTVFLQWKKVVIIRQISNGGEPMLCDGIAINAHNLIIYAEPAS